MVTRLEAVRNFLNSQECKNPLWHAELETQVNVAQGKGQLVRASNRRSIMFENPETGEKWHHFRIPYKANSDDHNYSDRPQRFDLAVHAEAIGSTGWNWKKNTSEWVAFDFDSIANHSKGLSQDELNETLRKLKEIPWVEVRRSKSGNGFHVFVHIDESVRPSVTNHNRHAALARSILHMMSGLVGFKFEDRVDCVGSNVWLWHRLCKPENDAFAIVKRGEPLKEIPQFWEHHTASVKHKASRKTALLEVFKQIDGLGGDDVEAFIELNAKTRFIALNDRHRTVVRYITSKNLGWWDQNHNCLVTHTASLKQCHEDLQLRGMFFTQAEGSTPGDHNCFMFPKIEGWDVRRYTKGCEEHEYWTRDSGDWTRCVYDCEPDLDTVIRTYNGILGSKGDYEFRTAKTLAEAVTNLGFSIELDVAVARRPASLYVKKDCLIVKVPFESTDPHDSDEMKRWRREPSSKPRHWVRVFKYRAEAKSEPDTYDHIVRAVTFQGQFEGFWLRTASQAWVLQPKTNLSDGIRHYGFTTAESKAMVGAAIINPWAMVSEPFQPEYLGDRKWNLKSAQLAVEPRQGSFPTWEKIFTHLGAGLDDVAINNEWCQRNGIASGADYLKLWLAYMFQRPKLSLPYLSFYSKEENSGKSTLHESLSLLFVKERGYQRAENALRSQQDFNGELHGAILCIIEEINLNHRRFSDRIKDWVTSRFLSIHPKGGTPFIVDNCTHWMQFSNNPDYTPMFEGDTRIVLVGVNPIPPEKEIDRYLLDQQVEAEAPHLLYFLLNYELPEPTGRLQIPVLTTVDKIATMDAKLDAFDQFLKERVHHVDGHLLNATDLYQSARHWIAKNISPEEANGWSDHKMARAVPRNWVKGIYGKDRKTYFANKSLDPEAEPAAKFILSPAGRALVRVGA